MRDILEALPLVGPLVWLFWPTGADACTVAAMVPAADARNALIAAIVLAVIGVWIVARCLTPGRRS